MRMRLAFLLALALMVRVSIAQTETPDAASAPAALPPKPISIQALRSTSTAGELQKAVDQLTQSNRDLLDLLKKQQEVLQDMQFDRRLQARQIQSLEEKLEDALYQNTQLQSKVDKLEADAAVRPSSSPAASTSTPVIAPAVTAVPTPSADTPAPPPDTYLPKPDTEGESGTMSWHRLFTLKGDDVRQTDLFHIQGRSWRVLWHNQDKAGKVYANTSALFINAFPKDDTIPLKVCSKLGSGGDATELLGPGNYYLRIEASGGSWELAVEDFR